jgi:glycosyltransferase involved in cell wall biosynthesis
MVDASILIPTYNRLWSLPKAVASCFETNLNIELIVIDDGSTDGTEAWLAEQKHIIYIRQENQGKDWAINKGFTIANGKYIRFLDSDDWHLPYSTDQLFEKANSDDLDIVCAGYELYNEAEGLLEKKTWTICDDFLAQQLGECDSSHYSAYLFKKDFIKDIPHRQEYGALDDRQFMIEVAMKWPTTGYIHQPTLAHRAHGQARMQTSSGLNDAATHLARLKIYKKAFSILSRDGQLTQRRKDAAVNILWPLTRWIAKYDIGEAKDLLKWIMELKPGFKIPHDDIVGIMYKTIGFSNTEKILGLRRSLIN